MKTPGTSRKKPWDLTTADIRQVWAEALCLVEAGEKLYLDTALERLAKAEQSSAMEQDEREGLVREYLDVLLPSNWAYMEIWQRRNFIGDPSEPTQPQGSIRRNSVCNLEIWCECFGKPKEDIRPADSYAIAAIMERVEGWERSSKPLPHAICGKQRVYVRTEQADFLS